MIGSTIGLVLAVVTSFIVVLIHYEALRYISLGANAERGSGRLKILTVVLGVLLAHMCEAGVFALAFWFGAEVLHAGHFIGSPPQSAFEYYYFALETFTTQSVGDLYPVGGLRVIASLEPLVGLILIAWSASLTFVAMRRYWRMPAQAAVARGSGSKA